MTDYTDDYLAFYKVYPRHEGKADGQKAWTGLPVGAKQAALADVEKRVRLGAYSQNKKLIQLPASYLRSARWDDDWEDTLESSRKGDDLPNTGPLIPPAPHADPFGGSKWDALANRLLVKYVRTVQGMNDRDLSLAIDAKNEAVALGPALDEDIANGTPQRDAVIDFASHVLKRIDVALDKNLEPRMMRVRSGS